MQEDNKEAQAGAKMLSDLYPMLNEKGQEVLLTTAARLNIPLFLKSPEEIRVMQDAAAVRPAIQAVEGVAKIPATIESSDIARYLIDLAQLEACERDRERRATNHRVFLAYSLDDQVDRKYEWPDQSRDLWHKWLLHFKKAS